MTRDRKHAKFALISMKVNVILFCCWGFVKNNNNKKKVPGLLLILPSDASNKQCLQGISFIIEPETNAIAQGIFLPEKILAHAAIRMAVCGSRTCFLFFFPADILPMQSAGCAEIYFQISHHGSRKGTSRSCASRFLQANPVKTL